MLNEFLIWWSRQMLDLLPGRLRRHRDRLPDALIAEVGPASSSGPATVRLIVRRRRREGDIGSFVLDAAGIRGIQAALRRRTSPRAPVLRLRPGLMLEREVILPLAAERDLARVLDYEMDRNTPFSSGEVFWTWAMERRDPLRGRLHVRLSIVPRSALQAVLAGLEQAGLVTALLEAPSPSGRARLIVLHRPNPARERWLRRGVTVAATACALLAITASALPFALQSAERDAIEERLAQIKPRVAQAEALRREIVARAAGTDAFAAQRARVGNTLQVLAALTEILPDNTFLTDLTLRDGKLGLEGQSADAARLIAALSADPVIRNPAFGAPVTRQDNRTDQFSIRAEIAP